MTLIHPTAIVTPGVKLAEGVVIGPYCVLDGEIAIGAGTKLLSHVVIGGRTKIGTNNKIFPFASLGHAPQDLKYKGEKSELVIGDHNVIREHVTMNPGTEGGGMVTTIGSHCLFMVASHVAHDCVIGGHVILANNATLGGHVQVGDHAIIGGLAAVHQFVRIGTGAIIGGMSGVEHDVIPFGSVMGERASLAGLNLVGLKRRGFERDAIHALRGAYKMLFEDEDGTLADRIGRTRAEYGSVTEVADMIAFMGDKGNRSLCLPKAFRSRDVQAA
ncbi:MAG: acyl-ACP--UDP-N-acetylglucosamine O-acyltransferase [Pseudomonadota bacterium]|nr:acyl-ACP--UDP-N-acetylglucosamine O-acyltransferase [Pseudomonadota bacterium]MDE3037986.1 acyl-ACP--UDP-N-acetylglucosamine O-acyltransferase [Pseudomonadota bacterium]